MALWMACRKALPEACDVSGILERCETIWELSTEIVIVY
jgi:hypothetical protein